MNEAPPTLAFFKAHTIREAPGDAGLCECASDLDAAVWYARLLATESYRRRCERAARRGHRPLFPRGSTHTVLVRRPGQVSRCFRVQLGADWGVVECVEVDRSTVKRVTR